MESFFHVVEIHWAVDYQRLNFPSTFVRWETFSENSKENQVLRPKFLFWKRTQYIKQTFNKASIFGEELRSNCWRINESI